VLLPICGRPVDDIRDSLAIADALLGRAPRSQPPEEALWAAGTQPVVGRESPIGVVSRGSVALRDMGYFVSRSPGGAHVVIHAGPHGYLNGGHAHAAALSLTVSLRGRPFLIDPGTACYTIDAELRERFRSTAFHNTLVLDGRSQSQPDGPFHWAGMAAGAALEWKSGDGFDYFVGTHDGYRPLEHKRHVLILHDHLLAVVDLIDGSGDHAVATHWHLDPRWTVELSGGQALLSWGSQRVELAVPQGTLEHFAGDEVTGLGWHSPVYGRIEPGSTLRISHRGTAPIWLAAIFSFARNS
jgi:hypothetical protein